MFTKGLIAASYRMSPLGPDLNPNEGFSSKAAQVGRTYALFITNTIKLGGLIIAIYEIFTNPQPPAVIIGLVAFMMAGAQVSEDAIINVFAKMFSASSNEKPTGGDKK